jgi:hypothetical protein
MSSDIFISCKNLDEHGVQTRDSEIAAEVYKFLTGKGLSVFLSTFTLEQLGASAYTREIDSALESATVLLAIGTSADHLNSEWVRYEWDSFSNAIRSGGKPNGRVFTYIEGMPIRALPWALRHTQTFVHSKGSLERLYNFINKALPPSPEERERENEERLNAERRETERLEAERRKKEERDRLETEQREKERLEAEQRERERQEAERRLEHESQSPKPAEPERVKPPPPSSGATPWSPSKQVIAFLAIAAALVVAGLIYLVEEQAPRRSAVLPLASSTPQPTTPSSTPSAAESLAQAQRYLDAKDFAKALPILQKAADAGNPVAMFALGLLYENGQGVNKDYGKAREWYQKAADAGDTRAKGSLLRVQQKSGMNHDPKEVNAKTKRDSGCPALRKTPTASSLRPVPHRTSKSFNICGPSVVFCSGVTKASNRDPIG